ncbi:hypothetical protein F5Y15DRAFT_25833 [Xylariaceae sp. FL0016]|nr:hypothetical protein F5Y15DRAFT_25833 [Xylariaceae sp. FL0016]
MPSLCAARCAASIPMKMHRCRIQHHALRWANGTSRRHASTSPPSSGRLAPKPAARPLPFKPTSSPQPHNPNASPSSSSKREPIANLVRGPRFIGLLGFGATAAAFGLFAASQFNNWRNSEPAPCYPLGREPEHPTGRPSIQSATEFDMHLDKAEWRLGITKLRRRIAAMARGHVLEVAVGTGRNFEFYDWGAVVAGLAPGETTEEAADRQRKKRREMAELYSQGKDARAVQAQERVEHEENAIRSFTGLDISPGMLDISVKRLRQVVPHLADLIPRKSNFVLMAAQTPGDAHSISLLGDKIRVLQGDAQASLPAPPSLPPSPSPSRSQSRSQPQTYDTILQTFGLCSVHDPVSLLASMAAHLTPGTGRILLLEHGRSVYDLVNGLLDRSARAHFARFGCWWNRDVEAIAREAARRTPGLEVVRLERPGWFTAGTHVLVEMRVAADRGGGKGEAAADGAGSAWGHWGAVFSSALTVKKAGGDANDNGNGDKADEGEKGRTVDDATKNESKKG